MPGTEPPPRAAQQPAETKTAPEPERRPLPENKSRGESHAGRAGRSPLGRHFGRAMRRGACSARRAEQRSGARRKAKAAGEHDERSKAGGGRANERRLYQTGRRPDGEARIGAKRLRRAL